MVPDTANREHAAALAEQLDAYLAGGRSRTRVAEIEGALASVEPPGTADWYEDLEEAVALFAPGEGPEYVTEESLEWIVRYARRHIKESFGL